MVVVCNQTHHQVFIVVRFAHRPLSPDQKIASDAPVRVWLRRIDQLALWYDFQPATQVVNLQPKAIAFPERTDRPHTVRSAGLDDLHLVVSVVLGW